MNDTEKKIKETRYFFRRMTETYANPFEFECNLQAFIIFGRSVTLIMQKECSKKEGFADWYRIKQEQMHSDEMLRFFCETRDIIIHEKPLSVGTIAHIKKIYIHSIPRGWGFAITGKGETVWITPTGEEFHASEFNNQVERVYFFDDSPKSFFAVEVKDFSALNLCKLYLTYLMRIRSGLASRNKLVEIVY